jgi:5-methylcytosine-specific restriction endonuclease McrA
VPWETDGSSARRQELPHDWDTIRKRVLDRDNHQCQHRRSSGRICGQPANQVDHWRDRDDHRDEALWALCRWHHTQKTQQESADARRQILAKTRHPIERPPGLR